MDDKPDTIAVNVETVALDVRVEYRVQPDNKPGKGGTSNDAT